MSTASSRRPQSPPGRPAPSLLLVEDDVVERRAIARALGRRASDLRVARDGVQALEILRGANGEAPLAAPWVILLDLNLPRMGGLELLAELRQDPCLAGAVVIVLTTSGLERDRAAASAHGVAGYIMKSDLARGLGRLLERVEREAR